LIVAYVVAQDVASSNSTLAMLLEVKGFEPSAVVAVMVAPPATGPVDELRVRVAAAKLGDAVATSTPAVIAATIPILPAALPYLFKCMVWSPPVVAT
jgi:hypothetical protein